MGAARPSRLSASATAPNKSPVAAHIRSLIRNGKLPLGARISDKQIALEIGVSRTPVREALVQLESDGLVTLRPQSGTFVIDLKPQDIHEICGARVILETGALKAAAEKSNAVAAQLGLLVGRASVALADGNLKKCDLLDIEFHETLVAMSGNSYLIKAYAGISDVLCALRHRMPRNRERIARAIGQHRRIVDLLAAGRLEKAVLELGSHVNNVERLLNAVEPKAAAV